MKKIIPLLFLLCIGTFTQAQNANFQWAKGMGGKLNENSIAITNDAWGNLYITGFFRDSSDFDPGPGVLNLVSANAAGIGLFIAKYNSSGDLVWAKAIDNWNAKGTAVKTDIYGNVYATGYFQDTIDADPGPGVYNLIAQPFRFNTLVLKLNVLGDFLWAKNIGGDFNTTPTSLCLTTGQDVLIAGNFYGTTDFDPGPGIFDLSSANGGFSSYIVELDQSGNFVWAKHLASASANVYNYGMAIDAVGNIYTAGGFLNTIDFDPGAGVFNLQTNQSHLNVFVSKYDTTGNFIWAKQLGGNFDGIGSSIAVNSNGDVFTTGYFEAWVDFDPGPNSYVLQASGLQRECFISKLDSAGHFVWAKSIGDTARDEGLCITLDDDGNCYVGGLFSNTPDFDPGPGTFNLSSAGEVDAFLLRLDTAGNMSWAKRLGSNFNDAINGVVVDTLGQVFSTGAYRGTVDFDPGAGIFNLTCSNYQPFNSYNDIFILKLNQDSCANMTIVVDGFISLNCANAQGYISVHGSNGVLPYSYTWNTIPVLDTQYIVIDTAGNYAVIVTDSLGCERSLNFPVNDPGPPGVFDLQTNFVATNLIIGANSYIWLNAFNEGCLPVTGSLKLVLPVEIDYLSANPLPDLVLGNILSWNFQNLSSDSSHIIPVITVKTNSQATVGDTLDLIVNMSPLSGDADTTNNYRTYKRRVTGAIDPNMKSVYPQGVCEDGYVLMGSDHVYTIQFQNTGTAPAFNIYILDTLDSDLDINTAKVVGSSHPMVTDVLPGNILKFHFDNINLPDSNADEPASHGYVIYEIGHNAGIASGTMITNKAGIYFDFNPPVYTNSVKNTVVNTIPICVTNIADIHQNRFSVYPNPANSEVNIVFNQPVKNASLKFFNIMGQKLDERKGLNGKAFTIDISKQPAGIYFVEIGEGENVSRVKLVKE